MSALKRAQAPVLTLFRVIVGLLFLCHGAASLFGIWGGSMGSGKPISLTTWPGGTAALIQLVTGILVTLGAATLPAALLASGSMAYAFFTVHVEKAFLPIQNGGEASVQFCWAFLVIAVLGPGSWSVDALLSRRGSSRTTVPIEREPVADSV